MALCSGHGAGAGVPRIEGCQLTMMTGNLTLDTLHVVDLAAALVRTRGLRTRRPTRPARWWKVAPQRPAVWEGER